MYNVKCILYKVKFIVQCTIGGGLEQQNVCGPGGNRRTVAMLFVTINMFFIQDYMYVCFA